VSIVVLGADGYLGWALMCRLATTVRQPIIAIDDLSKRDRVAQSGGESGIPILSFDERIETLRRVTGRRDIAAFTGNIADCIEDVIRGVRPRTVVHLAQIPSAPYSMANIAQARETLINNEVGNLALLFALRDHSPDTHLVKMGSMGEYAHCGVALGEGYVNAILDGEETDGPIPFPRAADDVYHITKINDTNYLAMACRVWGQSATDVMQSIVYGIRTCVSTNHPQLTTRFDCDPVFGSVVNRFVAQATIGEPLTVYGGGTGTTGLIALQDAISALTYWVEHPADRGEHRVINQATETRIAIRDIAALVQQIAADRGMTVGINEELDPRNERDRPNRCGPAKNLRLRRTGLSSITLEDGVSGLFDDILARARDLSPASLLPTVEWTGERKMDRLEMASAG
jgi:UDP-sulfoquinovose synthase